MQFATEQCPTTKQGYCDDQKKYYVLASNIKKISRVVQYFWFSFGRDVLEVMRVQMQYLSTTH